MKVINITEYHTKEFGFYLTDTLELNKVFKQGNDKIKLAFKNTSDGSIRWNRDTHGSGQL